MGRGRRPEPYVQMTQQQRIRLARENYDSKRKKQQQSYKKYYDANKERIAVRHTENSKQRKQQKDLNTFCIKEMIRYWNKND